MPWMLDITQEWCPVGEVRQDTAVILAVTVAPLVRSEFDKTPIYFKEKVMALFFSFLFSPAFATSTFMKPGHMSRDPC
jgi:hypothetical protein